jgi:hypothetical protein
MNQRPRSATAAHDKGALDRISHDAKSYVLITTRRTLIPIASDLNDPNFHILYHAPVPILILS